MRLLYFRCHRIFPRRFYANDKLNASLYLNPHAWKGLAADRVFELHNARRTALGDRYAPNDDERNAILSTFTSLGSIRPNLEYTYEIDNFKERHMNNTPMNLRGLPPRKSNILVVNDGATPHERRNIEHFHQISAYEMPLLAKFRQEYTPKKKTETPVKLSFNSDFKSHANSFNRRVTLSCNVELLNLNEKAVRKFKILAGNKFDHFKNTLKFSSRRYPEATQNARFLVDCLNRLIKESNNLQDDFSDVPIDTRHMKAVKKQAIFPEQWKRQSDAPTKRYKVVRNLVDVVKNNQDSQFAKEISPLE